MTRLIRPDEHDDPVAAVLSAHRSGARIALATSGTTGPAPRHVVRTTRSWWDSFPAYSGLTGVADGARVWIPGPLRSTMNLFAAVHAAWAGAVLVDDPAQADHACLTPAVLERRGEELARGARVVVAGAHLPDRLVVAARQRGLRISHYYGAAELSFVAAAASGGDGALRAFPRVEIEIRDEPAPGTIWVRSPWVCDDQTGPPGSLVRAAEGWATVGDVGSCESGVLVVRGRPDAIVTAGATVLVADVESVLAPAARGAVAVHAVPHPTLGQLVAATLTLDADRETLERLARDRLPVTHRPRVWRLVSHLPLTDGGKVDRAALAR